VVYASSPDRRAGIGGLHTTGPHLNFLTGLFQFAMGLARLGVLVNFISHTVIVAFTRRRADHRRQPGEALLWPRHPARAHFHHVIETLATRAQRDQPVRHGHRRRDPAVGILSRRYLKRVPYMIVAMVVGSVVAALVNQQFGAETTASAPWASSSSAYRRSRCRTSRGALKNTFFSALVVTVLALTEAVSIARSIAVKSEQRIDGNQEFIGQGCEPRRQFLLGLCRVGLLQPQRRQLRVGRQTPLAAVFSALSCSASCCSSPRSLPGCRSPPWGPSSSWWRGTDRFPRHPGDLGVQPGRDHRVPGDLCGHAGGAREGIFLGIITSLVFYLLRTSRPAVRDLVPRPAGGSRVQAQVRSAPSGRSDCPQLSCVRVEDQSLVRQQNLWASGGSGSLPST